MWDDDFGDEVSVHGVPARNFTLTYETSLLKHRDDGRFGIRVLGCHFGSFLMLKGHYMAY